MVQSDKQWDIVSSVGLTALGVAAARAVETGRQDPLIRDPLAAEFVAAAQPPVPMPTSPEDEVADTDHWRWMADFLAVRTRFFDEYFAHATKGSVRQVVLLAVGLDARAHRSDWPDGTRVYEVDQPSVLAFKNDVLTRTGATPRCERRVVDTDLRDDWSTALERAGFDPSQPTAWLAEGLLPYLPANAEEQLFGAISRLSAPGSQVAVEYVADIEAMLNRPEFAENAAGLGVDLKNLWNDEPRVPAFERLAGQGWDVTQETLGEAAYRFGREIEATTKDLLGDQCVLTSGQRD